MAEFDSAAAFTGGLLIGLASAMLYVINGRIAGISGVLHDLVRPDRSGIAWRAWFLAGLVGAGFVAVAFDVTGTPTVIPSLGRLAMAGVLVGVGTRMANGCTSGHGVCGLGRLSPRSLVAVMVFVGCGFVTTFVVRHVVGVFP